MRGLPGDVKSGECVISWMTRWGGLRVSESTSFYSTVTSRDENSTTLDGDRRSWAELGGDVGVRKIRLTEPFSWACLAREATLPHLSCLDLPFGGVSHFSLSTLLMAGTCHAVPGFRARVRCCAIQRTTSREAGRVGAAW